MPWFAWLLIVFGLFALLLSLPLRIRIRVDEAFVVQILLGPFALLRIPKVEKPVDLRQFTYRKHQKRLAKEQAKQAKQAKKPKAEKKNASKRKALQEGAAEAEKKENKLEGILCMVRCVFHVLPKLYGALRCQIAHLEVVVGGEEITDTALHYGILSQSLACLLEYLSESSHFVPPAPEVLTIRADFLAKKTTVRADISFMLRLGQIVSLLLRFVFRYIALQQRKA